MRLFFWNIVKRVSSLHHLLEDMSAKKWMFWCKNVVLKVNLSMTLGYFKMFIIVYSDWIILVCFQWVEKNKMDPKGDRLRKIQSGQLMLPESVLKVIFFIVVLYHRENSMLLLLAQYWDLLYVLCVRKKMLENVECFGYSHESHCLIKKNNVLKKQKSYILSQ